MTAAGEWRDRWSHGARRFATAPRIPVVTAELLGLAAVLELSVQTTATSSTHVGGADAAPHQSLHIGNAELSWQAVMVAYLLAVVATLSPALLRPIAAAVSVWAANVLMLGLFDELTVAGAAAQLIVLYRLGRDGSRLLAPVLTVPFLLFALAGADSVRSEAGALTVLLASLGPAAVWSGLARRARGEALAHSAAQEVIASTLMEHTARGERARIARELHDVVAHHISMIAVQAETTRLATPGMPDA